MADMGHLNFTNQYWIFFRWYEINEVKTGMSAELGTGIYIYLRENVGIVRAIWGQPLKFAKQFTQI